MSQLVIQSNEQSPLILGLTQNHETMSLSYGIAASMPFSSKQITIVTPKNGVGISDNVAMQNSEVSFDVTKMGYWYWGCIETHFGVTQAADAMVNMAAPIGLVLFSEVTLRSNNRILWTQSDAYCMARTQNSSPAVCSAIYKRAMAQNSVGEFPTDGAMLTYVSGTATTAYTCYTPLFIPFFEDPRAFLDLKRAEPLSIMCRYNSDLIMGLPSGTIKSAASTSAQGSLYGFSNRLFMWTCQYDAETVKLLTDANWNPSSPAQFLGYSSFKEGVTTGFGTSAGGYGFANRIKIASTVPAFNTYVYIRKVAGTDITAGTGLTGIQAANIQPFIAVDIRLNGISLWEGIPEAVAHFEADMKTGGSMAVGTTATSAVAGAANNQAGLNVVSIKNKILCISWNFDQLNRTKFNNALAFGGINNPEITVYTTAALTSGAAATYELVYCNEYYQDLIIDASNGSINVSTSN